MFWLAGERAPRPRLHRPRTLALPVPGHSASHGRPQVNGDAVLLVEVPHAMARAPARRTSGAVAVRPASCLLRRSVLRRLRVFTGED